MFGLSNKPAFDKNNSSKSNSGKNNNNRPIYRMNDGNGDIDRFGSNNVEHTKKSRKSKCQNLLKS